MMSIAVTNYPQHTKIDKSRKVKRNKPVDPQSVMCLSKKNKKNKATEMEGTPVAGTCQHEVHEKNQQDQAQASTMSVKQKLVRQDRKTREERKASSSWCERAC